MHFSPGPIEPRTEIGDIGRIHGGAAPDAQARRGIAVSGDVIGRARLFEKAGESLDQGFVRAFDGEADRSHRARGGIGGEVADRDRLRQLAEQLGVADRCHFYGYRANPWPIAKASDVFVFPSRSEGFGLGAIEAASLGLPLLCSDIPVFRELFSDREATFFELDNIDDMARKLSQVRQQPEKAIAARQRVVDCYTVATMSEQYEAFYHYLTKA